MSSANLSGGKDSIMLEQLGSRMIRNQEAARRRKFRLENANKLFERQVGEEKLSNEKEFYDVPALVSTFQMANPLEQMNPQGQPNPVLFMHAPDEGWKVHKYHPAWVPVNRGEFSEIIHSSKDAISRNQIRNKFVRAMNGGDPVSSFATTHSSDSETEMHTMEANIRIKEVMEGIRALIKQLAPDLLMSYEKARHQLQNDSLNPTLKKQLLDYIEQMGQVISIYYKPDKSMGCYNQQDKFEREGGKPTT